MKFLAIFPAAGFAVLAAVAHDQEAAQFETAIPGGISDGTPSPPAPKPEPIPFEVKSSVTRRVHVKESPEMPGLPAPEGDINITVQLVKDPGLPDPPPPLPSLPSEDPAVAARMAELHEEYPDTQLVFLSATVYDHSRTLLRYYSSGEARKEITVWSNLDFNHFSGFGTYQVKGNDSVVRQYGLMMGIGDEVIQKTDTRRAKTDETNEAPIIPRLPDLAIDGPAFVIMEEDSADRNAMGLIQGMHDLYRVEGARMEAAYHARIKSFEERKAFLLAHPPVPKDIEIFYWRKNR